MAYMPNHADQLVIQALVNVLPTLHEKAGEPLSKPVHLLVSELLRLHLHARLEAFYEELLTLDPHATGVGTKEAEELARVADGVFSSLSPAVLALAVGEPETCAQVAE